MLCSLLLTLTSIQNKKKNSYGYTFSHTQKLVYTGYYQMQERDKM